MTIASNRRIVSIDVLRQHLHVLPPATATTREITPTIHPPLHPLPFPLPLNPNQVPNGPNPKLDEAAVSKPKEGVPEWRVLNAAHGSRQRSGREAEQHTDSFRGYFKKVAAMSRGRLRVDKSTVQVRRARGGGWVGGQGRGRPESEGIFLFLFLCAPTSLAGRSNLNSLFSAFRSVCRCVDAHLSPESWGHLICSHGRNGVFPRFLFKPFFHGDV